MVIFGLRLPLRQVVFLANLTYVPLILDVLAPPPRTGQDKFP